MTKKTLKNPKKNIKNFKKPNTKLKNIKKKQNKKGNMSVNIINVMPKNQPPYAVMMASLMMS